MALAPILEAFTWGSGGQKLTPEQIAREREIAALLGQVDTSPIGDWTQGAARMANAFVGNLREGRANRAEQDNNEYDGGLRRDLLQSLGMGGATGGYAGGNPVAAALTGGGSSLGGVSASMDPASARVAQAHGDPAIRDGIIQTAEALGIDPVDLATAISYETAGTFDPTKAGPTTQWGQHRGLIQFGEPQAREHGVNWNDPVASQLGPNGAVASYLRSTGVQPGMGLLDIYSAINAGGVGLYNRSDANNGGAPGTVRDKVEQQMAGHRQKALGLIGDYQPRNAQAALESMAVGDSMPMADIASSLMPQQTQQPVQTAQAGGINPAIIQAISDPRASAGTQQIAQLLLEQQFSQQQAEQERMRAEQEAQIQMQQRMQAAQAAGVDPRFIGDDEIWKAGVGQQFQAPTTDIQEYEYARNQGFQGSLPEYQEAKRRAGATNITNNVGGEGLSPGQKKIDEAFADTYLDWNAGGFADSIKQLDQLDEALRILESGENITGAIGALPAQVAPFINPNGTIARENIEEVVQRSLREILGAQFTEKEGERLISRAFNPLMSPQENAKRVRRLMNTIGSMADAKQDMVDYFDENGTLRGYKGSRPTPSQIERLASEFGASPDEDRGNRTSSGIEWSIEE